MTRAAPGHAVAAIPLSAAVVMGFDRPPLQPSRASAPELEVKRARTALRVPERLMTARGMLDISRRDAASARSHTAVAGDTIRSIAERHYGSPEASMRMGEANASTFARNGQLTSGQILILPG
ncbi:LysM peptidoglycan-binding domain-containing protein [Histidinibacterium lentulum]|uniref:LysM domain-containing protein n=1 Tax=Histidinibacterium lentulum TaxID=2480588 RepID=A0A3N2R1A1_9RHOB|nr:hypothetical protein [Histidinibacterium lentulum]ROU01066.1 hypothetical protein EAT49_11105 [Histidinibacterium lentulum]